ncbi:MAG: MaoC family dehydratase [Gammaproteobacteria bacterium]
MTNSANPARAGWHFEADLRLPSWWVVAFNDATDSGNPMHDDTIARRLGFSGGLVPGVTLYGYLTRPLIAVLGASFLRTGRFEVRFRRPVYEGERVSTHVRVTSADAQGVVFELELRNPANEICVTGHARYPAPDRVFPEVPAATPLPASRRPATPEELRARPQLGTLQECFTHEASSAFVATMGDDLALYHECVHPAWLLRQANLVVDRNIAVGPWIHVASEIEHFDVVPLDTPFTVSARVVQLYAHKGNDYFDLDVVFATSKPVMRVLHKAIYRMADGS